MAERKKPVQESLDRLQAEFPDELAAATIMPSEEPNLWQQVMGHLSPTMNPSQFFRANVPMVTIPGKKIYYKPKDIDRLPPDALDELFAHELTHVRQQLRPDWAEQTAAEKGQLYPLPDFDYSVHSGNPPEVPTGPGFKPSEQEAYQTSFRRKKPKQK